MSEYPFKYIPIVDVCLLLGIPRIEVYERCRKGEINVTGRGNSNRWDIPTEQFRNHPDWDAFLVKREQRKQKNIEGAKVAKELWKIQE